MDVKLCDVCGAILKNNQKVYYIGILEDYLKDATEEQQEMNRRYGQAQSPLEILEAFQKEAKEKLMKKILCEKCVKTWDQLLKNRKEKVFVTFIESNELLDQNKIENTIILDYIKKLGYIKKGVKIEYKIEPNLNKLKQILTDWGYIDPEAGLYTYNVDTKVKQLSKALIRECFTIKEANNE